MKDLLLLLLFFHLLYNLCFFAYNSIVVSICYLLYLRVVFDCIEDFFMQILFMFSIKFSCFLVAFLVNWSFWFPVVLLVVITGSWFIWAWLFFLINFFKTSENLNEIPKFRLWHVCIYRLVGLFTRLIWIDSIQLLKLILLA